MLTLGSGVGVAVAFNRQVYTGSRGLIEAGHAIVESGPEARFCGCGQRGCIEAYASANSVETRASEVLASGAAGSVGSYPGSVLLTTGSSAKSVFQAAAKGDPLGLALADETARYLAVACINLARHYDPHLILLGGGMADAGETLFELTRKHFDQQRWRVLPVWISASQIAIELLLGASPCVSCRTV